MEAHTRRERLSCFDHTIHLTVGDGLNDTKSGVSLPSLNVQK